MLSTRNPLLYDNVSLNTYNVDELPSLPPCENKRRKILSDDIVQRCKYAATFIDTVLIEQWRVLQDWRDMTNQTAQFDSGYYGQHFASIVTGTPGTARRGKGKDMTDGSEVKTASILDGEDNPRWNHQPLKRDNVNELIQSSNIYYILFDWDNNDNLRTRLWRIKPEQDNDYTELVYNWLDGDYASENFQLHPPINDDSNTARKSIGTIKLPLMLTVTHNLDDEVTVEINEDPGTSKMLQTSIDNY